MKIIKDVTRETKIINIKIYIVNHFHKFRGRARPDGARIVVVSIYSFNSAQYNLSIVLLNYELLATLCKWLNYQSKYDLKN